MDLVSTTKDALRIATSQSLAALARTDAAARAAVSATVDAARSRAGLASPDDLRHLAAQIAALSRATDDLPAPRS